MKQFIFFTDDTWTGLVLRLTIGAIMLPHGAQKMFGLFGGYGFKSTIDYFTNIMKLPWTVAFLLIIIEFFCSLTLVIGVGSRVSAALFIIIMAGAIITTNYKYGLFMNWFGNQKGEGFEYLLLVIGLCIGLLLTGSGKYSLDGLVND